MSSKIEKFQELLKGFGLECQVLELPQTTRTAVDAAKAVNCQLGQIAKSIVFKAKTSGEPVLVIASGSNRIDERKIEALIGENIEKADADFVLEKTGYAIGGVPPVGHLQEIQTFIDEDLSKYREIWAAAGTPHAVFKLTPAELLKITGGRVIMVRV